MDKYIAEDGREIKIDSNNEFRGWDAADELILAQNISSNKTLVIDDSNGFLTTLLPSEVISYSSSCIGEKSINNTAGLNHKTANIITDLNQLPDGVDLVVIKLPKFIDLLEYYLQIIGKRYPGVQVVIGGMVKYMPISMVRLTESYFDNVTTSLAKKKARLILGNAGFKKDNPPRFPKTYSLDDSLTVASYPGVFSADHLDIGTRFLRDNIPAGRAGSILDLGCGSGVLGLTAKKNNPEATVHLTDISYHAIASAKESFRLNDLDGEFHVMDTLKEYESDCVDIILCNPPFHQGNRVVTDIAISMFKQSRRVLRRGGTLFIVANKHLGYHKKLRAIFHNLTKVAENEKFFIYSVRKV